MPIHLMLATALALLGAVLYLVSANGKVAELARIAFAVGLLVAVLHFGGVTLR